MQFSTAESADGHREGAASPEQPITRHFTVAVFVVYEGQVLLHAHRKLARWLPPGGHIEPNELPDEAATREVLEETGLLVRLLGPRGLPDVTGPRQLVIPAGIQVEPIEPGHEHIDLVYFAVPATDGPDGARLDAGLVQRDQVGWYSLDSLAELGVDDEIAAWSRRAVGELGLAGTAARPQPTTPD